MRYNCVMQNWMLTVGQQTDRQRDDQKTHCLRRLLLAFVELLTNVFQRKMKRDPQPSQRPRCRVRVLAKSRRQELGDNILRTLYWFIFNHCDTRNSSGDEIANMNFLHDDIVHVIQNTIDSCINSATARRGGCVLERMFTKFSEITQCNGHYAVQGHSRSPILAPIESSYTTSY